MHGERTYLNRAALEEIDSNDEDNIRPIQPQNLVNEQLTKRRHSPRNCTLPKPPTSANNIKRAPANGKKVAPAPAPSQPNQRVMNGHSVENGVHPVVKSAVSDRPCTPSNNGDARTIPNTSKIPTPEKPNDATDK